MPKRRYSYNTLVLNLPNSYKNYQGCVGLNKPCDPLKSACCKTPNGEQAHCILNSNQQYYCNVCENYQGCISLNKKCDPLKSACCKSGNKQPHCTFDSKLNSSFCRICAKEGEPCNSNNDCCDIHSQSVFSTAKSCTIGGYSSVIGGRGICE